MKNRIFKILACALVFTIMLSQAVIVSASDLKSEDKVLFSDSFEKGIDNWEMVRGSGFKMGGGQLVFNGKSDSVFSSVLKSRSFNYDNAETSLTFKYMDGSSFGILLRMKDELNYYLVRIYFGENNIKLFRRVSGGELIELSSESIKLNKNAEYDFHATMIGDKIDIYINDNLVLSRTDGFISSGAIGFEATKGKYIVDDVCVYRKSDVNYVVEDVVTSKYSKPAKFVYVSPNGDDKADGSKEHPLLTLNAAKLMAKKLKTMSTPVEVIFEGGEYFFSESVSFSNEDSGVEGAPITYKAEEGANVVFKGSKELDVSKFTPVADSLIKSRLYDSVKDKVMQLDLGAQGINPVLLDYTRIFTDPTKVGMNCKTLGFYLNDRRQNVARWPNSGYARLANATGGSAKSSNLANATNSATLYYSEPNPARWTKAENMFVEGFLVNNYTEEWAPVDHIKPDEQSIKLKYWTAFTGISKGNRWAAINLLEEIDIPGEWYVDKDKMMLYYYPPYNLNPQNDKLELSVTTQNFITMDGSKYINFEGIEFAKNQAHGGTTTNYPSSGGDGLAIINSSFVNIRNCVIRNIGFHGLYVNKCKNMDISGNLIYDTGLCGIIIYDCGDRATLTSCNIDINNNIICDVSTGSGANQQCNILLYGDNTCGVMVQNNKLYNAPNSAIRYKGNENIIQNNEIYKTNLITGDAGAIYTGRLWSEYGTVVQYNYIHDLGCKEESNYYVSALYLDDFHSGDSYLNNIINLNNKIMTSSLNLGGGRDCVMNGNTVIGAYVGIMMNQRTSYKIDKTKLDYLKIYEVPFTSALFKSKYPGILENYNDVINDQYHFKNTVTNNLFMDCDEMRIDLNMERDSVIKNNPRMEYKDIFVDAANQDFRVKKEAKKEYGLPDDLLDESFDINSIGIKENNLINESRTSFVKTYPVNNQSGVTADVLQLSWEKSPIADEYVYTVATDKELKNIIKTGHTNYTSAEITGLSNDTVYYWSVTSKVTARVGSAYECKDGVTSFSTSLYDNVDKTQLESNISLVTELLGKIREGENVGDFKAGTINKINEILAFAKQIDAKKQVYVSEITDAVNQLVNIRNTIGAYKNSGYLALNLTKGSEWKYSTKVVESLTPSDGSMEVKTIDRANIVLSDNVPADNILCFTTKLEADTLQKGYVGYALNQQNSSVVMYNDSCYYVCVKKDKFELQNSGNILQTKPNNGEFQNDKLHEIQFGAVTTEKGVNLIFKIDGTVIFDYLDVSNPKSVAGMFAINMPAGKTAYVGTSTNVPGGLYEFSDYIKGVIENGEIKVFNTTSAFYSETGKWINSKEKGFENSVIRITTEAGAVAKWEMQGKPKAKYKVYLWNSPKSGNDKNVAVRIYNAISEEKKTLDLTQGKEGFIELGEYEFTDENNKGILTIELISSGNGVLPVNCARIIMTETGLDLLN